MLHDVQVEFMTTFAADYTFRFTVNGEAVTDVGTLTVGPNLDGVYISQSRLTPAALDVFDDAAVGQQGSVRVGLADK